MKKTKLAINFAAIFTAVVPLAVFAASLIPCGGPEHPCNIDCFFLMIKNIINFLLLQIATPLAVIAFIVAGFMFLMGGSEKTISRGKAIFRQVVTGLVLAFGAWLIIDTILGNLLQQPFLPWNEFPTGRCTPISSQQSSSAGPPPELYPTPLPPESYPQ